MATTGVLRGRWVQLSNLREAAAGKGKNQRLEGQWDKRGHPPRPLPTGAPAGAGDGGRRSCCGK